MRDPFDRFSNKYFKDDKEYMDYTNYLDELNLQIKDLKLYNRYLEIKNSNTNPKKCTCVECILLFFKKLDTWPESETNPELDIDPAPKHISQFKFLEKWLFVFIKRLFYLY